MNKMEALTSDHKIEHVNINCTETEAEAELELEDFYALSKNQLPFIRVNKTTLNAQKHIIREKYKCREKVKKEKEDIEKKSKLNIFRID